MNVLLGQLASAERSGRALRFVDSWSAGGRQADSLADFVAAIAPFGLASPCAAYSLGFGAQRTCKFLFNTLPEPLRSVFAGAVDIHGDPVVAADFVAALQRLVDPATRSQYAQVVDSIRHAREIIAGRQPPTALGVVAPDPATVVIELESPTPYLPGLMSHWSTMPVHRPTLAREGAGFVKPGVLVGNGAFRLVAWVQGAQLDLERNRQYWNDAATRLEAVRFVTQSDENAEYQRWRAPFCDESGELLPRYRPAPMVPSLLQSDSEEEPASVRRTAIPVPRGPVEVW